MGQDDRQRHIPNWLRQMQGWEETPDWLLRFIEKAEGRLSLDDLGGGFGSEGLGAFGESADETAMDSELAQAGEWFDRLSEGAPMEQEPESAASAPAVSESGEGWLSEMTEVFDTSLEAPAGDESLDWLDQLQPSQDEALPSVGTPDETGSLFDAALEGISEVPEGEGAETEPAQGAVPDWLAGLDQGFPEDEEEEDAFSWDDTDETLTPEASESEREVLAEEETEEAGTGGLPGWLVGEGDGEPEMPDWMAGLGEGEGAGGGTADWLSRIEAAEEETAQAESIAVEPVSTEPPPAEPVLDASFVTEATDWLSGIAPDEEETAPAEPTSDAASMAETPDWLTGLAAEAPLAEEPAREALEGEPADWLSRIALDEEEPAPAEPAPDAVSMAETPDWLTGPVEEAPLAEESAGEALEGGPADWLSEIALDEEEAISAEPTPEAASAETPDWLTGLVEEAPPVKESAVESVGEGLPDWLSETVLAEPEEAAPEPRPETVSGFGPETAVEAPDWFAEPEPAAAEEPVPEVAAEDETPDWLLGVSEDEIEAGEGTDVIVSEVPSFAVEATTPAEAPDWLARLSVDAPAEEATGTMDVGVPDWLSTLESPAPEAPVAGFVQPTPDWLSTIEIKAIEGPTPEVAPSLAAEEPVPVEAEAPAAEIEIEVEEPGIEIEAEAAEPEIEPGMFDEGAPDWLVDAVEMPSLDADTAASESEDGVPAWLSDLDIAAEAKVESALDEASPALEEPVAFVSDEEEVTGDETSSRVRSADAAGQNADLPGWLVHVDQHVPVESDAPALAEAPPGLSAEPAPSAEEEEEQEEEVPGWLQDMGDVASSGAPPVRKGVTAWLQDVQEMPVPEETVSEQDGHDVEMPSWLQDMDLGTTESEQAPGAVSESLEDMPDWLREMPQEDISGLSVDTAASAPSSAPDTLGESSMQGAPSWMQQVYAVAPSPVPDALGLPAQEEAAAEEAPEWLDALREQDQEPKEDELPVETSGPLAGLRGVLNPEPLLAILPKATYKPIPPVDEADQSEARRVAELLAQPVRRTTISTRSPGRAILASLGRWLIYIALVAVMLISPLQSWVRPPVRSEAQSFYYAIDALQPGSEVLLVVDYEASLDGELTPQLRAIIWHLLHRNLGIVFLSLNAQGPAIIRDILSEIPSAIAGEHYLDLGYVPAQPASLRGFVHDPIAGAKTLVSGEVAPADTTLGQRIVSFDDLDLIVTVTGDHKHVQWWIEQVGTQTRADLLAAASTSAVPYLMPYYDPRGTGQLAGILSGLSGAVQYEQLASEQVAQNAWPNYVVLVNAQMLLVVIVLVSGVSSIVSGLVRRARRAK